MGKKTAAAPAEKPKPDPVLFQVVKYIRKKVPVKQKIFNQKRVDYCSGRKMLDVLMQSSFASGPTQLITTREDGVGLLQRALDAGYFFRGKFFDLSPKGKVKARKILMGHEQQLFCDEMEPFVWIYNPPSVKSWIYGGILGPLPCFRVLC
eukprot:m.112605 g.112605  ORF g.112605 m.112605 type:complete len:150 (+) comp51842_c1_seq9:33-482(+)